MAGIICLSYCSYKVGRSVEKYEMGVPELQKRYVEVHGADTTNLEYIFGEQEQGYYNHECYDTTHVTCDSECVCDGLNCKYETRRYNVFPQN